MGAPPFPWAGHHRIVITPRHARIPLRSKNATSHTVAVRLLCAATTLCTTTASSCYFVYTTPPDYILQQDTYPTQCTCGTMLLCLHATVQGASMYPCMPCWSICNRPASPRRSLHPTSWHAHTGDWLRRAFLLVIINASYTMCYPVGICISTSDANCTKMKA